MTADESRQRPLSMVRAAGAVLQATMLGWSRSRAPLGSLVLVCLAVWFDWAVRLQAGRPWYSTFTFLAGLMGVLAAYDPLTRLRETGALRLMLLRGSSPLAIIVGEGIAATIISGASVVAFALYLLWADSTVETVPLILGVVAALGFVAAVSAVTLAASVSLPRDVVAVLALLILALGARSPASVIPHAWSAPIRVAIAALWDVVPATNRLDGTLGGLGSAAAQLGRTTLEVAWGLALGTFLLARPACLHRRRDAA